MAELWLRPAQPKGQWVHGMSWSAVVGSHAQAVARLRARQMRASHYLLGGERAMAAGCARIRGRGVCYSAAQQVAAHCAPDAFAAVVSLDDRHWLVAVQDGAVLAGGDQVFTQEDQALAALQRLGMEPSRRPDRARQALDGAPLQATRLRPLPPRPAFMLAMLLLPLAGVALWAGWGRAAPARDSEALAPALAPPSPLCLGQVLDSVHRLPMRLAGWRLAEAQCLPRQDDWQCRARYQPESLQALSADFHSQLASRWELEFPGLDEAVLRWRAAGICQADPRPADSRWMRALQPWRAVFTEVWMGPWSATAEGRLRPLRLNGPLRSYALPAWDILPARWRHLRLQVDPAQGSDARHSPLMLFLEGDIHADTSSP